MTVAIRWLHRNLFAKPFDIALSLLVIPLSAWVLFSFAQWVLVDARWDVLAGSIRVLLVGIYPIGELWRAWISAGIIFAMLGAGLGLCMTPPRGLLVALVGAALASGIAIGTASGLTLGLCVTLALWASLAVWHLIAGSAAAQRFTAPGMLVGLGAIFAVYSPPGLETWGGLLLSVVLTLATCVVTVPFGILLAFGRQSRIASLRVICTAYIEVMRSVPLILVVYWIWIIVPLLAPSSGIPSLVRGMAGFALFFAAYVAEYVRSGLQALPKGQVEAARSLGMSTWSVNVDIVLPQALRVVVPALVGQVLDIFNGATLVFIIGLTDFLRAGQMILADPQNSGRTYEIYVFMFAVYFTIGATITYASRRLEAYLARGSR